MTHEPKPNVEDLDPDDAIVEAEYQDPTPDPISDPDHPDFVEPGRDYSQEAS